MEDLLDVSCSGGVVEVTCGGSHTNSTLKFHGCTKGWTEGKGLHD